MRAIALLSWWQLRNAIRTTLTEPKKLIPMLVFFGIFGMQTLFYVMAGPERAAPPTALPDVMEQFGPAIQGVLFLLLALASLGFLEIGFSGGALAFSLADIDYLFPSPVSRRVVLAYHLPALVWKYVMQAGILVWLGYIMVWRSLGPEGAAEGSGWLVFTALTAWMAGYACLAVTIEIVFGKGRAPLARKAVLGTLLLLAGWVAFLVWRDGFAGLAVVERSVVMHILFYPCRLMADVMLAPVTGAWPLRETLGLLAFFAAMLALVMTRRQNFYETSLPHSERMARIRQAARGGNIGAILSLRARDRSEKGGKTLRGMERARAYAIPPFGRGAVAVLWANLAAAAKRPFVNFVGPFAGGVALSVAAVVWIGDEAPFAVMAAVGYVAYMMLVVGSRNAFRQSIERQGLVRPLPIAPRKLVFAEVAPVALTSSLFGWGAMLPLAFAPGEHALLIAGILALPIPVLLLDLCLLSYTVMLWYPLAQDKMQQLIAGFVSMALFGAYMAAMSPFVAVPLLLGAPPEWTVALAGLGATLLGLPLAWMATSALRKLAPA